MMTQTTLDVTRICADQLTQGDIILHLGQRLQVWNESKYTQRGMMFEVMPIDYEGETYQVCFDPR